MPESPFQIIQYLTQNRARGRPPALIRRIDLISLSGIMSFKKDKRNRNERTRLDKLKQNVYHEVNSGHSCNVPMAARGR